MEENKKPKRKRVSLSRTIRMLKLEKNNLIECNDNLWKTEKKLRYELSKLQQLIPLKYFRIDFKIKSNSDHMVTRSEIIESYTIHLAIDKLKSNKTHPDSFELIDVKVLG